MSTIYGDGFIADRMTPPNPPTYGRTVRQPQKADLSNVAIPHRNSSMREPYVPQDKTVYRPGSDVRHPSRGASC